MSLTAVFETTIALVDEPDAIQVPVRIKRLNKTELEAFNAQIAKARPRGEDLAPLGAEDRARVDADFKRFVEESISSYITVPEGALELNGQPVTDGAGFIAMFHARAEILGAAMAAIIRTNRLEDHIRKNSNSPRGSEPGLAPSIPLRGGDRPGPIAGSAERSTTAAPEAAMDESVF